MRTPAAHGYAAKLTSNGGRFQRRYLVLRGSILLYYESHLHSDPKGAFLLDGCTVQKHARLLSTREGFSALLSGGEKATDFALLLTRPAASGLRWELDLPTEADLDAWLQIFGATGVVARLPDTKPLLPRPPEEADGAFMPTDDRARPAPHADHHAHTEGAFLAGAHWDPPA